MPNWITNKLTISSDKPEVLSFVKERVATTTKEHGLNPFFFKCYCSATRVTKHTKRVYFNSSR